MSPTGLNITQKTILMKYLTNFKIDLHGFILLLSNLQLRAYLQAHQMNFTHKYREMRKLHTIHIYKNTINAMRLLINKILH